jgi:peptidoglycan/LPS O-acetylase OafA/YrhL
VSDRVSPAVAAHPGSPRWPGIDGLRGLAILSLVLFHCWIAAGMELRTGGWIGSSLQAGVSIFFAVSSFLIYRPYVAAHAAGVPPQRLRDHARRRALRVLPGYWVALVLLSLWPGTQGDVLGGGWWRSFLLLQNLSVTTMSYGLIVTWSLAVEITFYALAPTMSWIVRRAARRWARPWWQAELAAFGALAGMTFATIWLVSTEALPLFLMNTLPVRALWFTPGLALAVLSVALQRGGAPRAERIRAWLAGHAGLLWGGAVVCMLAAQRVVWATERLGLDDHAIPARLSYLVYYVLMGAVGGCVLAPIVAHAPGRIGAFATWRPLMLLGLVSYGVLLYHLILANWISLHSVAFLHHYVPLAVVTFAASLALAIVSYRCVELPFLRLKYRRRA